MITISEQDFNTGDEIATLQAGNDDDGAVVTFTGQVRNQNNNQDVTGLFLEHYPNMTENALSSIISEAKTRWSIGRVRVIHRVGQLYVGDNIVFVGVTSKHRGDAFSAAEYIMDYLKIKAPFWKKETTSNGDEWLDAKAQDHQKARDWL
ncbi:molybdopterin synthase catalytic subunit MoaE [Thalassotalea atypica]|uniref:molybdopterin synthase catalytic subunit MoaE n=1 Tax=Thalassotalea atypica TaxID=2054316 RepID=UPI002572AE03|nr:molybdopterin synthase catalytic subunit MoaE [Thalassotalea atypica]